MMNRFWFMLADQNLF